VEATDDAAREARRKARSTWPVRRLRVGEEHPDDVSALSPDERVRLVGELTLAAWRLAGKELPSLPRSQWPGTVIRSS
jgi:hypothetical protein